MAFKDVCCVCGKKLDFMTTYNKDLNKVCSSCSKIIKSELNFGALRGIGDVSTVECIEIYQCYMKKSNDKSISNMNEVNQKLESISQKKKITISEISVGLILIIFGIFLTYNTIFKNNDKSSTNFSYTIEKTGFSETTGLYFISGIVTNNSDYNADYLKIEFICYDKDGNNIGTIYDATQNLLPNDNWHFESTYIGTKSIEYCNFYKITPSTAILEIK